MWKGRYCIDGDSDPREFKHEDILAVQQWARNIDRVEGRASIFGAKFRIDKPDRKQWGTDYWWLLIVKE